jgi:uncharacterized SAM-binding protein YcdF (DUF218 family)
MNPVPAEGQGLVRRARGCLVVLAATLAAVAVLGFVVYQLRAPLLTRVGGLLYHEDALEPADAIVVLGGGSLDREVEAADLFSEGYAPVVVLTRAPESPIIAELQARGLDVSSQLELRLDYLGALGVPREATTVLQPLVESTQAEAELIAEWAESRQIGRIIVVTAGYHTSRTRLVFDRVRRGRPTEVVVRPSSASGFAPATWWHSRSSLRTGLFEIQKYMYYRFMYLLRLTP